MTQSHLMLLRRDDIAETPVEDDIFLVVPETEGIFHLNAVGTALWRLLAEPRTRDELITLLSAAFSGVPPSTIARDVDGFLKTLKDGGLLAS
jgi:hypothetical protein